MFSVAFYNYNQFQTVWFTLNNDALKNNFFILSIKPDPIEKLEKNK